MNDAIPLPARLDAATAPLLAAELLKCDHSADFHFDASETVHIGAMGAQVLASAWRTARAHGSQFIIGSLQERASQQLTLMGLTELTKAKEVT